MIKWILLFIFVMFLSWNFVLAFSQNKSLEKIIISGLSLPIFCYLMLC